MADLMSAVQPKVIVVPRQLEAFFYDRLSRHFAERGDVRVVVDRRHEDRACEQVSSPGSSAKRRAADRRRDGAVWKLADMPPRSTRSRG